MAREKVQFTATDGQQLSGIIDRPDGDTRACALFAHCFIDNASELFVHAKHPKSFVSLDKADHLLSREQDSRYAGAKIHAHECADCETSSGKIDEFQRELTLEGNLDAGQRQRLLEIADMCPVHRALHNEVKIRTTLLE